MPASPQDTPRDLWAKLLAAFSGWYGATATVSPQDSKRRLMAKVLQLLEQ